MKKILRYALLSAVAMFSTAAMAQNTTTVGAEDNSTAWWTAFSDPYTIEPNKTLTLQFKNYSSKIDNWSNWAVILTQDVDFGTEGSEYLVLRADNWGWQYALNTGSESSHDWFTSFSSNFNWETFKDDMDGSTEDMTIQRVNNSVTVRADITTAQGVKYFEEMVLPCGDGTQNIRAYLTVSDSHLVIDNDATKTEDSKLTIGATDCSTGFWGAHSPLNTIEANKTLHMEFANYTSGVENCHNWVLVVSDGQYLAGGDTEYLVLRADNYGWASKYDTGDRLLYRVNPIPGFDELTDQTEKDNLFWSTFRSEMQGAKVVLDLARWGNSLTITATATATNGEQWVETFTAENFVESTQNLGAWLTVDHSCLVIDFTKTTITNTPEPTAISAVKTANNANAKAVRYNMAGQQVGADFKGLVIENGKKFVVK